jgi:hypothetical protein
MAFQEAQEYWETECGNWYSKLSLEVRVNDEEEGREGELDVNDGMRLVRKLADDLWRGEDAEGNHSTGMTNSERTGARRPKKD